MNIIIKYIMILSTVISFLGCSNKEEFFLKKHKVILCCSARFFPDQKLTKEAIEFEQNQNIKFDQASILYLNFLHEKGEKKDVKLKTILPSIIIDQYYIYSFKNIKTLNIATFGIWINANNGEILNKNDTKLWLHEDDIIKNM